jgi:type IV secretory pathway TraG/TraD family ATPase VirD4
MVLAYLAVAPVAIAAAVLARVALDRAMLDRHARGALVCARRGVRVGGLRRIARRRPARAHLGEPRHWPLRLAGRMLSAADETKHFKLIGTTGTGKSTAIGDLLQGALARGDRAVVTDPDGAYRRRFFDRFRGDVILNPFEPYSARWSPFAEARRPYDYEELARGLIADTDDASGREWRAYARTLVAAAARRCSECGRRDVRELWRLLAVAELGELREMLAGTPAQPFVDADNARMFGSIRSVAVSALAALQHVGVRPGAAFSIRDWVGRGRGALFIPYSASHISALRTLIATWVRLAIFEALSGPEIEACTDAGRGRLWFVIDELDALGPIDGLKDALARLRKFGGCCVLGFQSAAQVSSTYGAGAAQTIVENCGNTLILRCAGSENGGTSAFASRLIGEREVVRRQPSRSRDRSQRLSLLGSRRSVQVTEQRVIEPAVLPAELEQLPDLTGYLRTVSSPRWTLVRLRRRSGPWPSTISE